MGVAKAGPTVREFYVIQFDRCLACSGGGEVFDENGDPDDCGDCGGTGGRKSEVPLDVALKAIVFKDIVGTGGKGKR